MRTRPLRHWILFAATANLLLWTVPTAAADMIVTRVDAKTLDGESLGRIQVNERFQFVFQVNNTGTTTFTGDLLFDFDIISHKYPTEFHVNETVSYPNLTVAAGASVNLSYELVPTKLGTHTLRISVKATPGTAASQFDPVEFTVAKTQVIKTSLLERLLEYGWFYALFLGLLVLYVAVVRVRRPY